MSELIGEYTGRGIRYDGKIMSTGDLLLIDFHLNDSQIVSNAASCYAGFIGYVEVVGEIQNWPFHRSPKINYIFLL